MAGLLDQYNPQIDGLGLGLLGASQALLTPRRQGGGVGAAFGAFGGGLMQGEQMQRQRTQDAQRGKLIDAQIGNYASEAEYRKAQARKLAQEEAQREAIINSLPEHLRAAARIDLKSVAPHLLPQKPESPLAKLNPKDYTPESWSAFTGSGMKDTALLKPYRAPLVVNGQIVSPDTAPGTAIPPQSPWEYEVDPATGQPRMKPGVFASKSALARAGASNQSVTMIGEKEESKVVGKGMGEAFLGMQNSGMKARSKINNLSRLETLMSGYDTGKLTPVGKEIASYAASVGINIDKNLGNKEAAEALSNEMALQLRDPSSGAGMPGAMSDADRQYLQNMVPNLSKSPGGNKKIIETQKRLAKREIEIAKMASDYRGKKGTLDPQFYDELQRYSDANPLFQDLAAGAVIAPDGKSATGTIGKAPAAGGWTIKRVP